MLSLRVSFKTVLSLPCCVAFPVHESLSRKQKKTKLSTGGPLPGAGHVPLAATSVESESEIKLKLIPSRAQSSRRQLPDTHAERSRIYPWAPREPLASDRSRVTLSTLPSSCPVLLLLPHLHLHLCQCRSSPGTSARSAPRSFALSVKRFHTLISLFIFDNVRPLSICHFRPHVPRAVRLRNGLRTLSRHLSYKP